MWTSRLSKQGQVTIPKEIRKILEIGESDIIAFTQSDGGIIIQKASVVVESKTE